MTGRARATIFRTYDANGTEWILAIMRSRARISTVATAILAAEMRQESLVIRHAGPSDHARVIAVVDSWWGGRPMAAMLPRLFFTHFEATSFVADDGGELAAFLCG